jgi:hypothetical protein
MEPKEPRIGIRQPLSDGPLESGPTEYEGPPPTPGKDVIAFAPRPMPDVANVVRFVHDLVKPTHRHWPRYCDWRMSKCPPRDQTNNDDRLEDLIQATLELCGEAGELGSIIDTGGLDLFVPGPVRASLLDELGDVTFELCWALDAWGVNPLRKFTGAGLDRHVVGTDENVVQRMRLIVEAHLTGPTSGLHDVEDEKARELATECAGDVIGVLRSNALSIASAACGTANVVKKLLYQGKRADGNEQAYALCMALTDVRRIALVALGLELEDVVAHNITKLDARFPNGWSPNGGIRGDKA